MKLATLPCEGQDGRLVVVSSDGQRWHAGDDVAPNLQYALDNWQTAQPALEKLFERLNQGEGETVGTRRFCAPLPRAWQWLDGSAFPSHSALMQQAFKMAPIESPLPLMYQGMSHQFLGPEEDVPLPSEADGIDFEGEFGVITDAVPMGVSPKAAAAHIKLVVQINDWSLRVLAPAEMKTGFGWVQAKPACSLAPYAVTPDDLGSAWRDCRLHLPLVVDWNGQRFGAANGSEMAFGFDDLIAHAARTRGLPAGTIIGSGTISNPDFRSVGSSCIAERRGIEILDLGEAKTPFMRFGDRVRMAARTPDGAAPFGVIDQSVIEARGWNSF